jgi:hypothetical protein
VPVAAADGDAVVIEDDDAAWPQQTNVMTRTRHDGPPHDERAGTVEAGGGVRRAITSERP